MSEIFFPALFPGFTPPEELAGALDRLAVVHAELDREARTIRLQAQAETNQSTDNVVTVTAGVSPARLGKVVTAPGVVGVRGTGQAYDGLYYVPAATHQISLRAGQGWDYTQQLTLTREGTGTTTKVLEAL